MCLIHCDARLELVGGREPDEHVFDLADDTMGRSRKRQASSAAATGRATGRRQLARELHDQDGVLAREAHQHDQADLDEEHRLEQRRHDLHVPDRMTAKGRRFRYDVRSAPETLTKSSRSAATFEQYACKPGLMFV